MNDDLLVKFLLNEATAAEAQQVQEWIAASNENEKYFAQFERIWNDSAALAESSNVEVELAWQKFKQRVDEKQVKQPVVKKISFAAILLRVAAVFVLCFGAWLAYQQFAGNYTDVASNNAVLNQTLPDGSRLVLNKNTNLSYAANFNTNRNVKIKNGEVFFDVAHDRSHPFVIDINDVEVKVVGTSFNIKKTKNSVEVIVESGVVRVKRNGKEMTLTKGESVFLSGEDELVKTQTRDELYNYYRTGVFVASNTSLSKLTETLTEAYGTKITLSEHIKNEKIFITLPLKYSLQKNLEQVCLTLDLKMQRNPDEILLSKK